MDRNSIALEVAWQETQGEYRRKIRTAAWKHYQWLDGFDVEDVEQELLVVLWECVIAYDPDKGARFNTFFWHAANNRIRDLLRDQSRLKRKARTLSLDVQAVRAEVERRIQVFGPEEEHIARVTIREREERIRAKTDEVVGRFQRARARRQARA